MHLQWVGLLFFLFYYIYNSLLFQRNSQDLYINGEKLKFGMKSDFSSIIVVPECHHNSSNKGSLYLRNDDSDDQIITTDYRPGYVELDYH